MKIFYTYLLIFLLFSSCKENQLKYNEIRGEAQGSTFYISYSDSLNRFFGKEIETILIDFDKELSVYLNSSLVSKFNNNEIDSIDLNNTNYFKKCLLRSNKIKRLSDGYFNITTKNLYDYIGYEKKNKQIDSIKIDSILNISDDLIIRSNFLFKKDSRIKLDFNAIAQGYSVDVIGTFLERKGIKNYMVEIGGEMRVKGLNSANEKWKVAIESPNSNTIETDFQEILNISNKSIATSGSYRKFKEINGVKYSHAINPKTGYGVTHNLLSVTVITNNCIDADAFATAFLVVGRKKAIEFIEINRKIIDIDAYFIESDSNRFMTYQTTNFLKYLK